MADTRQRAELFAVLREMEADTVRMYDAVAPQLDEGTRQPLQALREGHAAHVVTLEGLLGMCGPEDSTVAEDIRNALELHVMAVEEAVGARDMLTRLLEAERTNAAEYAVLESSQLQEDERAAVHRLHEEQRGYVREIESQLPI